MVRLQKVIAESGVASRRKAEKMIAKGLVSVDGQIVTEMGFQVKKGAKISVDGKLIQKEDKVYYLLNKPKKYICSNSDEHSRLIVTDLIECEQRIFPVGRLDYDTTGLLILTNDGDFANKMIHPRYHIPKTYELDLKGILISEHIKRLEKGIDLDGKTTLPAKIKITNKDFTKKQTTLEIRISEGRNHQVKNMFAYFGYEVTRLNRKRFGFLSINDLAVGKYRKLKPYEVVKLKELADSGN
ncbi:MAG: pseudouridine synthase [Erysipelotrichaceae bacterium]|nr:pseudouridine synthase [Erysipelotrichaceae bacterium]MDD3923525.1 pseudouridine synthase [Erysipelotrichaceae bacterium]MDD4642137.1 pseudouridine synthase [Erysipelotrichaceae bacterium]